MRNLFLIIAFSLLPIFCLAQYQSNGQHYLYNPDIKLQPKDFKGKAESSRHMEANTACAINLNTAPSYIQSDAKEVTVTLEAHFLPYQSWKKGEMDEHLLNHEQLHYDLAEVYARKMRKRISTDNFSFKTLGTKLNRIYMEVWEDYAAEQSRYDRETDHSINKKAQLEWNDKVASLLRQSEQYKATVIVVPLR